MHVACKQPDHDAPQTVLQQHSPTTTWPHTHTQAHTLTCMSRRRSATALRHSRNTNSEKRGKKHTQPITPTLAMLCHGLRVRLGGRTRVWGERARGRAQLPRTARRGSSNATALQRAGVHRAAPGGPGRHTACGVQRMHERRVAQNTATAQQHMCTAQHTTQPTALTGPRTSGP
jgi:hypothetical protein